MAQNNQFNNGSDDILFFLFKKRKPIIIITLAGAIASIIISLIITPMFKSNVILYPVSSVSVSKSLLSNNTKGNLMAFGEEEETEQLLQILQSNVIRDHIVDKFDLFEHYDIDTTSKFKHTILSRTYKNNISFKKTKYQSVNIEVFDKDPQYAADIANEISQYADTVINNMHKKRAWEALLIVEYEYKKLNRQIQRMSDSISALNKMGILDYTEQTTAYTTGLAEGIASGKISNSGIKYLEQKLKILEKYGHTSLEMSNFIKFEQKKLSELKGKWVEAGVEYAQNMSNVYIIEEAVPAEKKSKPVRWLIVVISTISVFLFAVLLVAFSDFFRNFTQKIKNE